jgi:hypothetical protein
MKSIFCDPEVAKRDCRGCTQKEECHEDMRLYQLIQKIKTRYVITEEPIPRAKIPIIDADQVQRDQLTTRISLRRLK